MIPIWQHFLLHREVNVHTHNPRKLIIVLKLSVIHKLINHTNNWTERTKEIKKEEKQWKMDVYSHSNWNLRMLAYYSPGVLFNSVPVTLWHVCGLVRWRMEWNINARLLHDTQWPSVHRDPNIHLLMYERGPEAYNMFAGLKICENTTKFCFKGRERRRRSKTTGSFTTSAYRGFHSVAMEK